MLFFYENYLIRHYWDVYRTNYVFHRSNEEILFISIGSSRWYTMNRGHVIAERQFLVPYPNLVIDKVRDLDDKSLRGFFSLFRFPNLNTRHGRQTRVDLRAIFERVVSSTDSMKIVSYSTYLLVFSTRSQHLEACAVNVMAVWTFRVYNNPVSRPWFCCRLKFRRSHPRFRRANY